MNSSRLTENKTKILVFRRKKDLSEVGFEPTPSVEDQNAGPIVVGKFSLESGALDRSAILTYFTLRKIDNKLFLIPTSLGQGRR